MKPIYFLILLLAVGMVASISFGQSTPKSKKEILRFIKESKPFLDKAEDVQASVQGKPSIADQNIDLAIKIVQESIEGINKLSLPNECSEYKRLSLKVLDLTKGSLLDRKSFGEKVLTEEVFLEKKRDLFKAQEECNTERMRLLRLINAFGIDLSHSSLFEREEKGTQ